MDADAKKPPMVLELLLILLFFLPLGYCTFAALAGKTPDERRASICIDGQTLAFVMSQKAVSSHLKAPGTAKFPKDMFRVVHAGDCIFRVAGAVDAQNGFGALIRNAWVSEIQYDPETEK